MKQHLIAVGGAADSYNGGWNTLDNKVLCKLLLENTGKPCEAILTQYKMGDIGICNGCNMILNQGEMVMVCGHKHKSRDPSITESVFNYLCVSCMANKHNRDLQDYAFKLVDQSKTAMYAKASELLLLDDTKERCLDRVHSVRNHFADVLQQNIRNVTTEVIKFTVESLNKGESGRIQTIEIIGEDIETYSNKTNNTRMKPKINGDDIPPPPSIEEKKNDDIPPPPPRIPDEIPPPPAIQSFIHVPNNDKMPPLQPGLFPFFSLFLQIQPQQL